MKRDGLGIALAMIGAALGYPVELVIPANVSVERKRIIEAYGAKTIESDPLQGLKVTGAGFHAMARKIAALAEAFGVRTAFHGPGDIMSGF